MSVETFTQTPFLMGDVDYVSGKTVAEDAVNGDLKKGSVLGEITAGTITTDNSGNTASTGDIGTVTAGKGVKVGDYNVECVAKVADAGTFKVIDPLGNRLDDAIGDVAYEGEINFTIEVTATDFEVGDKFTVTVPASGKLKLCDADSVDGSEVARFVLAHDVDATGGDVTGVSVIKSGRLNGAALIFGGDDVLADHDDELRSVGIVAVETAAIN